MELLPGKKTYIVAALTIAVSILGYLNGDIELAKMIEGILAGLGLGTLRRGIAKV